MNCYTIPADKAFISHLAGWILASYGQDAAELTQILILLPNRRSCRALREAFLEATGGKPLLLPRIQPIGDVEEPFALHSEGLKIDIPPAISPIRREFLLTQLVMDFKKIQSEAVFGRVFNIEQAAELARQLALFIDEVARFGLNFDRLSELVPEELATHWQQTLDFLNIISHAWPKVLEQEGAIDPVDHRNRLLQATAKAWQATPPAAAIIAAGSTGSTQATAALLATIARLPQGKVILPGLDTDMMDREWDGIKETHPQFGLKQLLETMGCKRSGVQLLSSPSPIVGEGWGEGTLFMPKKESAPLPNPLPQGEKESTRLTCLRAILQSPEATSGWSQAKLPLAQGLKDIHLLTAETLHDEARMIAIALRQTLETPGKTAALITPDRTLARMVASQMQRFGVEIDDSAGHSLIDKPSASLMRLLTEMVANQAAPVSLLALLRHPLTAAGRDTADCRLLSRNLELELLRGLRRTPGLEALRDASQDSELKNMLAALSGQLRPMFDCFRQPSVPFRTLLETHIACAQWLADTGKGDGSDRIWSGEAGNRLAEVLTELLEHADLLGDIDPVSYPSLFDVLLSGHNYYPRFGLHPRLHILSPIEARLQHYDTVILGSLNEGTWPTPSEIDPWMSRPMRANFKLPPTERAIGQSAHEIKTFVRGAVFQP